MARTYRPVDREQEFLLPPSMIDWLPDDHVVWFVIAAVKRLDTAAFHRVSKLGGVGRAGYDPDMLLTLLVYAMAHGERSSRQIERLCASDVAFRVICASDVPDHTVLARFRQRHQDALTDLLTESLVLAAELGMVSLGVVAFDGTKIAADASMQANRSEGHLRGLAEGFVEAVAATDAAEDALFGEQRRGDEPPAGMDRTNREWRIAEALEVIAARREAQQQAQQRQQAAGRQRARAYEQAASRPGRARPGPVPAHADEVVVARARWQRERAHAAAAYETKRARREQNPHRAGRPPTPPDECHRVRTARAAYDGARARAEQPETETDAGPESRTRHEDTPSPWRANLTDPQSRLLKTRNGWIQGYNCQTSVSTDEFITSARATQDANDLAQFQPTMHAVTATAAELAQRVGRADLQVGTMIGDAGYDSEANLDVPGPDRLIADTTGRTIARRAPAEPVTDPAPEDATPRQAMNHRLRTEQGRALYARRSSMIETPNAWLKDRRGLRRFARRGLAAANSELNLAAAVTNLLKLHTRGITTTHLQTG